MTGHQRIKLKLTVSALLLIAPYVVTFLYDDAIYLRYEAFSVFFIFWLFKFEKAYLGFLKVWFEFHVLNKHRRGLSPYAYDIYTSRNKYLRESKEYPWEQLLLDEIINESGEERNKVKLTGKKKSKVRFKHRRKFDGDKKNVKATNFRNPAKSYSAFQ